MKNKKLLILVLFLSLFSINVYAEGICSKNGYTVIAINGIFTDKTGAELNAYSLRRKLPPTYNNQIVSVDYIYNPTHIAGAGDLVDSVRQGLFDPKSDYDLVEMLNSASDKVKTQKLLIVGHSQGNFYANSFYNKVVDKDGGVPSESLGVYGVATPDSYVAGEGKYLTSDTDTVIAEIVGRLKNIMKPNTHIELEKVDGNGHSFSDVYLKYKSEKIVSDIKSSFDKLKTNTTQSVDSLCISPQKITTLHKATGVALAVVDYSANYVVKSASPSVNLLNNTARSLASTFTNLAKRSLALVGFADEPSGETGVIPEVINQDTEIDNPTPVINDREQEIKLEPVYTEDKKEEGEKQNNSDMITTPKSVIPNQSGGANIPPTENTNIPDIIPPVISLLGESIVTINQNTAYVDPGATGLDNIDGIIDVTKTGVVDNTLVGSYILTYTLVDKAGNVAIPVIRTVNVLALPLIDTIPPVISLVGEKIINVELNSLYTESGATALDAKDGIVLVVATGTVDTSNIGEYIIIYKALDAALNIGTETRTVNVVNSNPVASLTSTLSLPVSGIYKDDGLYPNEGKNISTKFNFQVVYTDINNNPPQKINLHVKNDTANILLNDIVLNKITTGGDLLSDGDYRNGELYTVSHTFETSEYSYSFTAYDKNGNYSKILPSSILKFTVTPSTYTYIPKYTFGAGNGDGNDWQMWVFNGSYVYDWTDTYVNNYLHEQFKIKNMYGYWCSQCLERGIFNHDPQKGFESTDVVTSQLEGNPQTIETNKIYDVVMQWDSKGYVYNVSSENVLYASGRFDVTNMSNDMWVGWDTSSSSFTKFPSGNWIGVFSSFENRGGGSYMMLTPYPVYNSQAENTVYPPLPLPPAPVLSSEKKITSLTLDSLTPKVIGVIDEVNHTISLTVPYGTIVTSLTPTILVSEKASILPVTLVAQDFTNPITYTVTGENSSTEAYVVSVIVEPKPTLPPAPNTDSDLPTILSYTINGSQSSITLNPRIDHVTIVVNANKNVDWKSIQIENESDHSLDKTFQDGAGCVDGTKTCTKPWDGTFPGDRALLNGNYKIKVHMVDLLQVNGVFNDYNKYLDSVITVVGQAL